MHVQSGGGDSYELKGRGGRREKEKERGGERGLLVYDVPSGNVSANKLPPFRFTLSLKSGREISW